MTKDEQVKRFKILLVGDSGTGKTSLLSRLIANKFDAKCEPTSGCCFETHDMLVDNQPIKADIWDLGGKEKYRAMTNSLFSGADGIFLVYDISKATTLKNITEWLKDIIQFADPKTVVKLVGNKSDLEHQRAVPIERVEQMAADIGLSFTETSALNASNVKMAFQWMVEEICATTTSVSSDSDHGLFSTCSFAFNCMTKDNPVEHLFKDLSHDDIQQQEEPFHIVLVDIKKAADEVNPIIHCIQKPLEDDDLKYVALSYRWGELQETIIDTQMGYTASITSFDLQDFYQLCYMITMEADLRDMDYVWVDAICVDQTNCERRKANMHQMSTIYERASYILAVPDLHKRYLKMTSTRNIEIMKGSAFHRSELYHLIHGNSDQLACIDQKLLDFYKVPDDPTLRQLLTTSTDHFTDGFMKLRLHHFDYNAEGILDHIYATILKKGAAADIDGPNENQAPMEKSTTHNINSLGMKRLHDCNQLDCPLDLTHVELPEWRNDLIRPDGRRQWHQLIHERSISIRQSVNFMADLIKDWSSRVWVISEFNIAKKKNNMKYWFTQLATVSRVFDYYKEDFVFFKFDFDNFAFSAAIDNAFRFTLMHDEFLYMTTNDPVYLTFHQTMNRQLNQQTFFEMMLESRASKNEDRFYAIFPISPEYKNTIGNKDVVASWKIDTLLSVKLKLFEVMNTKDKLTLLFLTGNRWLSSERDVSDVLPTFGTLPTSPYEATEYFILKDKFNNLSCNFDLTSTCAITLCDSKDKGIPYLNLKPKEYFVKYGYIRNHSRKVFKKTRPLWRRLQLEDPVKTNVIVCIPSYTQTVMVPQDDYFEWWKYDILLNGNFEKNIWVLDCIITLDPISSHFPGWDHFTSDDHPAGFNIY